MGAPLGRAGSHGSKKNGELWCPHGVTISKGQAFVADYINGRIVVYDCSNMEHVRTFSSRGSEPGCLEYPCGIAIKGKRAFGVQYHPEASPGPQDSFYLFQRFADLMAAHKA